MKKLLCIAIVLIIASSCTTIKLPEPKSIIDYIDYSGITSKGIFVTESNSVSFDYEPLGSVSAIQIGGWVKVERKKKKLSANHYDYDSYYKSEDSGKRVYVRADLDNAIITLTNKLKDVGANGVINLKISFISGIAPAPDQIIITGMAIKK